MHRLVLIPPPLLAIMLAGGGLGLGSIFDDLPTFAARPLGALLMAAGCLLIVSTLLTFRQSRTTVIPHGNPTVLITDGPYSWSRNPIYLGLLTGLLGFALYFGNLFLFLAPPLFAGLIGTIHVSHEETKLWNRFSRVYAEYRDRVERWF